MEIETKVRASEPHFDVKEQGILPFYHMISDGEAPHVKHLYTFRSIEAFEADLDHFLTHYRPIDLHELRTSVKNGQGIPAKRFFLSFDDGFKELYDNVRPLLLRKGIPATFFINSAFLDNRDLFYRNKVSLLIEQHLTQPDTYVANHIEMLFNDHHVIEGSFKERIKSLEYKQRHIINEVADVMNFSQHEWLAKETPYLTSEQVREMIADGFTFGGHSIDHPKYATIGLTEQVRQTQVSVEEVSAVFNLDYKVFAFPFHDQFVSQQFFKTLAAEHICEVSFGTAELQHDSAPSNLQRMWFENTNDPPAEVIQRCFSAKEHRRALGTDTIRRPFGELRTYTIGELDAMIAEGDFWHSEADDVPITRYRARAHVANPRAAKTDLALVTMYHDNRMVGYLGVMPDRVFLSNAERKIGWLTCWWTHPDYGGKGIGQSILDRIYDAYNGAVGCSEFTDLGQQAAERSGKLWKLPLHGQTYTFAGPETLRSWLLEQPLPDVEYIAEIDAEAKALITAQQKNELSRRSRAELTWLLRYPWVITAPFEDRTKSRLFFSSTARRFFFQAFKVYSADRRIIGVVILRVRDDQMTVPYVYAIDSAEARNEVARTMALHAAAHEVQRLKVYHPLITGTIESTGIPIAQNEAVTKNAFFSPVFSADDVMSRFIQDGDGDNAFT